MTLLWIITRFGNSHLLPLAGRDRVVIGRSDDADVMISSPHVGREHLVLRRRGEGFVIAGGQRLGRVLPGALLGRPPSRNSALLEPGTRLQHGMVLDARDAFVVYLDEPTMVAQHLIEPERVIPLVHPFVIGSGRNATESLRALDAEHALFRENRGSFTVVANGPTSVNGERVEGATPLAPDDVIWMNDARAYRILGAVPEAPPAEDPMFEKLDLFVERGELGVATSLLLSLGDERFGPWLDDVEILDAGRYFAGAARHIGKQVIFSGPFHVRGPLRPLRQLLGLSLLVEARPERAATLDSLHFDGARNFSSSEFIRIGRPRRSFTLDVSIFDRFPRLASLTLDRCSLEGVASSVKTVNLRDVRRTQPAAAYFPNATRIAGR